METLRSYPWPTATRTPDAGTTPGGASTSRRRTRQRLAGVLRSPLLPRYRASRKANGGPLRRTAAGTGARVRRLGVATRAIASVLTSVETGRTDVLPRRSLAIPGSTRPAGLLCHAMLPRHWFRRSSHFAKPAVGCCIATSAPTRPRCCARRFTPTKRPGPVRCLRHTNSSRHPAQHLRSGKHQATTTTRTLNSGGRQAAPDRPHTTCRQYRPQLAAKATHGEPTCEPRGERSGTRRSRTLRLTRAGMRSRHATLNRRNPSRFACRFRPSTRQLDHWRESMTLLQRATLPHQHGL